jgi:DNA-binding CsgD family transcriptional regulator
VVLLERTPVLAAVDNALERCGRGGGQLFVVEGPAGIGKTSVLAAARSRAAAAEMDVLHARASELERTFSYGVVRQLFEPLLRKADDAARRRLFDGVAIHAARLFDPDQVDRDEASENESFALIHALYWLALNLAEARPVVIAIDDLQWVDAASLRWLSYLARRLDTVSVCAFVTLRAGEDEDPTLVDLLADPGTVIARPAPLTASAVAELVRAGLGADAEADFCLACHRASGGNPLFLHELVRTFQTEGLERSIEVVERVAPETVSRSVKVRLSRLPAEAAAAARAIAVLGDGADGAHVAQLADVDSRALSAAAAALARLHLIHFDEPLRFVHPVVRNAVYESISGGERAEAHARAAALLAGARAAPAAVAAQLLAAPPGTVQGAAAILGEAARRAAAEGSPESTAMYLRRALDESLTDRERADVLLVLARAELRIGAPTAPQRVSDALEFVDDPQLRSSVQLQLARYQIGWNRRKDATRTLEQALAEREVGDDDLSRRLEAELLSAAMHDPDLQVAVRARLDAPGLDRADGPGTRLLLGVRAYRDATRGTNRERALADAERALPDLAKGIEETDWSLAYGRVLHVLLLGDDFDAAGPIIDELVMSARRLGGALAFSSASLWRAALSHARGALVDAEADARLAFDGRPAGEFMETPWLYGIVAQVLVERGAVDEAARILASFETEVDSFREEDRNHVVLFSARAHVASAKGDQRAALSDALASGRIAEAMGFVTPAVDYGLSWRTEAALAHHFLGEDDAAQELARTQLELARGWGAPRTLGQALRILGVVEGGGEGLDRLEEAASVLESSPAHLDYGYALTDLGSALRRRNQRRAAREPLRLALELAQRGGAKLLAGRAHEELIATGARPRRLFASGVDALTPSERRVAAMAAEGLTNREIAQALFVTLRTVETHLSGAFRKLDVSARTQLAAALAAGTQALVGGRAR